MFRCAACNRASKPGERHVLVVYEEREKVYLPRSKCNRQDSQGNRPGDPGGKGREAAKSAQVCQKCFDGTEPKVNGQEFHFQAAPEMLPAAYTPGALRTDNWFVRNNPYRAKMKVWRVLGKTRGEAAAAQSRRLGITFATERPAGAKALISSIPLSLALAVAKKERQGAVIVQTGTHYSVFPKGGPR